MFDNLKVLMGKRRIMKYFLASGLACALFLMACQPDEEPTPPDFEPYVWADTTFQDPEFLSYWLFKEGSQWIYKRTDTTAEMYDTATVVNYLREIQCKPSNSSCGEFYMTHIAHTHHDIINEDFHSGNRQQLRTSGFQKIYVSGPDKTNLSFEYPLVWPLVSGSTQRTSRTKIAKIDTSIFLGNLGRLLAVQTIVYEGKKELETQVFTAKNLGFVKYQFPDGSTWELVEHHLKQ